MRSALLVQLTTSKTQRRRGRHVMLPLKDVRDRFGMAVSSSILEEKKRLEANKPKHDPVVYYMKHPEAPDEEESHLILSPTFGFPRMQFFCNRGPRKQHDRRQHTHTYIFI